MPFDVAGLTSLVNFYRDEAIAAYNHADGLADPMLDEGLGLDDGLVRGRDFKMMAAAFLYNVTGDPAWENVVNAESVCAGGPAVLINEQPTPGLGDRRLSDHASDRPLPRAAEPT